MHKLFIISSMFILIFTQAGFSQDVFIQGGGTLNDWANISKYKNANREVLKSIDKNRIVFIGNSITESWSHFDPEFFETNPFVNRGIGGQTTPQMLIRFRPDVVNLRPKAVVILAGINDIAENTGPIELENTAENIFSMAEIAKANDIQVLICSVLPARDFPWSPGKNPSAKVIKLNELLKAYCQRNKIIYVEYYAEMEDGNGGLKVPEYTSANDLVHPNKSGYKVMEEVVLKALTKLR